MEAGGRFTDIFEEPGPRYTPFHGGFGLLNTQGIKKSAYHAYALMNKLGPIELENKDGKSVATTNRKGDVQLLFWDYTYTLPEETNNQDYYNQDHPAKVKNNVLVDLSGMPDGAYQLEVYKIGYKQNDPYSVYCQMGKPDQLSKKQVASRESTSAVVLTETFTTLGNLEENYKSPQYLGRCQL